MDRLLELLDPDSDGRNSGGLDPDEIGHERTIRGEFVRRVRRAALGEDAGAVLHAGLWAMDGRLVVEER